MQQLSSTISLGDQTNTIVLPLRAYPFLLAISRLPSFLAWSKASSHPFLSPYLSDTSRLTLTLFTSGRQNAWLPFPLCSRDRRSTRPGGGWWGVRDVCPQNNSTLFSPQSGEEEYCFELPYSSLCQDKIRAHTRAVSAGVRAHHQCRSTFNTPRC